MKHPVTVRRARGSRLASAALAALLIALAGGSTTWAGTPDATPAGFRLFSSAVGGYQMAYPAAWNATGASLVTVVRGQSVHGVPTTVYVTPLGMASAFESVDVLAATIVRLQHKKGTTVVSQSKMRVAGSDARVMNEQQTSLGVASRATMVVFLSHNRAWMISYSAALPQYARTLGAFRTMLSTFTFIK